MNKLSLRTVISILLFPVSLLWYDRVRDDIEIPRWLFWFGATSVASA